MPISTPSGTPEAIKWYEEGLALDPKNPDASTDLGISYYYTGQTDRALKQFEQSLSIDPRHTKTMLNQGIVLAFRQAGPGWRRSGVEAGDRACPRQPGSPGGASRPRRHQSCRPSRRWHHSRQLKAA